MIQFEIRHLNKRGKRIKKCEIMGFGKVLDVMQDADKSWLNSYSAGSKTAAKKRAEAVERRKRQEAGEAEFFAELRENREKSNAEFLEKRRADEEEFRAGIVPLKPLPNLPPALVLGEPHDSDAPMLVNPGPTLKRGARVGVLGAAEEGIFGFGLLGVLRKRTGLL